MVQIKLSEDNFQMVINCIHNSYMQYVGDEEIDQDVYAYNTMLDNLLANINKSRKEVK